MVADTDSQVFHFDVRNVHVDSAINYCTRYTIYDAQKHRRAMLTTRAKIWVTRPSVSTSTQSIYTLTQTTLAARRAIHILQIHLKSFGPP